MEISAVFYTPHRLLGLKLERIGNNMNKFLPIGPYYLSLGVYKEGQFKMICGLYHNQRGVIVEMVWYRFWIPEVDKR